MSDSVSDPIYYCSLSSAADAIRDGQLSPVELTEKLLSRIDSVDGQLMSYATVMTEQAMEAGRKAEQEIQAGNYKGPLHGMPIAVKEPALRLDSNHGRAESTSPLRARL